MSMRKVANIIEAIESAESIKGVTKDQIRAALEVVQREICTAYHLFQSSYDITLIEDQREYALNAVVTGVDDAVYFTEAGVFTPLKGINVEAEHNHRPGWKSDDSGTPSEYYVRNGYIGFEPTPDTDTDTGYPIVTIQATIYSPLIATDVTNSLEIPAAIPDGDVYVHSVIAKLLARKIYGVTDTKRLQVIGALLQTARDEADAQFSALERVLTRVNRQYKPAANPRSSWFTHPS